MPDQLAGAFFQFNRSTPKIIHATANKVYYWFCRRVGINILKNELTNTHICSKCFYFTLTWSNHLLFYLPPPPPGSSDDTSRHAQ